MAHSTSISRQTSLPDPDYLLSVFVGPDGRGGNELPVYLPGAVKDSAVRLLAAHALGVYEVVFIDDVAEGTISIYSPDGEMNFAGHPAVGAAWVLATLGSQTPTLQLPAGRLRWSATSNEAFVEVPEVLVNGSDLVEMPSVEALEALSEPPDGRGVCYAWARTPTGPGHYRARMLAPAVGVPEDEATGSMAVALASALREPELVVRQGAASVIHVSVVAPGYYRLGGKVQRLPVQASP